MVSCTAVSRVLELDGKKQTVSGSEVVCKDTVLFPEGGGQNCDRGTINSVSVISVTRRGSEAVHLVCPAVDWRPGSGCRQRLDWTRRLDNMQQHSGQHLLSALLEREHDTKVSPSLSLHLHNGVSRLSPGGWLRLTQARWASPTLRLTGS